MTRVTGEKQFDEANSHIENLELHIQTMEVDYAELAIKNEILRLELQQTIDAKQIAEEVVKLAEAERAAFGGASPAAGAGRSSAMLRQIWDQPGGVAS
jgi:archaellum component FlaC